MALKRKGNTNNSKENLTWKMNVLAAKAGEDTHIEQAKKAALGKRQHGEFTEGNDNSVDQEKFIKELNEVKKKKLESKLFHIQKEIKAGLKKSKAMETQKQTKKLREAQGSVASSLTDTATADQQEAEVVKKGKTYTTQDIERFQKELDTIKTIDMEPLAEKALHNFIRKNSTLKKDDTLSTILSTHSTESSSLAKDSDDKLLISNVEARLLGNKALTEPLKKSIGEMEMLLVDPEQRKLIKENKRKAAATTSEQPSKRRQLTDKSPSSSSSTVPGSSSLFMESLGGGDGTEDNDNDQGSKKKKKNLSSTEWEDPDFDKYYNGKGGSEKANRPGQSQRRRKWEALHGDKAKHLIEGKLSSRDQREMKKQKRLQKKALQAAKDNDNRPINNNMQGGGKKEENLEEFHPSWQAKRQQQEMMAKALSGGQSSANKIVFDDTD